MIAIVIKDDMIKPLCCKWGENFWLFSNYYTWKGKRV